MHTNTTGRIDVHSHLLPRMDDGCADLPESLACARQMVEAGYSHVCCTPHIWPNLPENTPRNIAARTAELQRAFDASGIQLHLIPGGELNLRPDLTSMPIESLPTYGMAGRYCLFDIWADRIPSYFWEGVQWLQSHRLTVILAHPERMRAVQDKPKLVDDFARAGLLLQGNLQCFGDPPHALTRLVAEHFLREDRYFVLGSDLHNVAGLPQRFNGLRRAIEIAGEKKIDQLTRENAAKLLAGV